jgi:hypothetical protein
MTTTIIAEPGSVFKHIPDSHIHRAISRQHQSDLQALKELLESEVEVKV